MHHACAPQYQDIIAHIGVLSPLNALQHLIHYETAHLWAAKSTGTMSLPGRRDGAVYHVIIMSAGEAQQQCS